MKILKLFNNKHIVFDIQEKEFFLVHEFADILSIRHRLIYMTGDIIGIAKQEGESYDMRIFLNNNHWYTS